MMTAQHIAGAANEGNRVVAKGSRLAEEILRSSERGKLSLGAVLDLAQLQAEYSPVLSQLKVNEPGIRVAQGAYVLRKRDSRHDRQREGTSWGH